MSQKPSQREKIRSKRARLGIPRRRGAGRGRMRDGPLTVFVHIPKTAGTTFAAVLRDNFPAGVGTVGNAFKGVGGFDPSALVRLSNDGILRTRDMHVLSGHLPFGIKDLLPPDTRFI